MAFGRVGTVAGAAEQPPAGPPASTHSWSWASTLHAAGFTNLRFSSQKTKTFHLKQGASIALGQTWPDRAVMASRGTCFCIRRDLLGMVAIRPASPLQGHMWPDYSMEMSPRIF